MSLSKHGCFSNLASLFGKSSMAFRPRSYQISHNVVMVSRIIVLAIRSTIGIRSLIAVLLLVRPAHVRKMAVGISSCRLDFGLSP